MTTDRAGAAMPSTRLEGAAELAGFGFDRPSVARVWDSMLGGKDNYPPDERVALELEQLAPGRPAAARASREFQQRVLWYLVSTAGVRQFLDLGAGLPLLEPGRMNTHQVVNSVRGIAEAGRATVVYIGSDPFCVAHGRALLTNGQSHYLPGDITDPHLLHDPAVATYFDSTIRSASCCRDRARLGGGAAAALVPGPLTHLHDPGGLLHRTAAECLTWYLGMFGSGRFRTRAQITGFFDGLQIVEPDLLRPGDWWPCSPPARFRSVAEWLLLVGGGWKGLCQ